MKISNDFGVTVRSYALVYSLMALVLLGALLLWIGVQPAMERRAEVVRETLAIASRNAERFLSELKIDFNVVSCRQSTVGGFDSTASCYYSLPEKALGIKRLECNEEDCYIPVCDSM